MEVRNCPHCQQPIYDNEALLCHFCGNSLERASDGMLGKLKYGYKRYIWIMVIFLLLAALFLIFTRY